MEQVERLDSSEKYTGDMEGMVIQYADGSFQGSFYSDAELNAELAKISLDDDVEEEPGAVQVQEAAPDNMISRAQYLLGR